MHILSSLLLSAQRRPVSPSWERNQYLYSTLYNANGVGHGYIFRTTDCGTVLSLTQLKCRPNIPRETDSVAACLPCRFLQLHFLLSRSEQVVSVCGSGPALSNKEFRGVPQWQLTSVPMGFDIRDQKQPNLRSRNLPSSAMGSRASLLPDQLKSPGLPS